METNTPDNEQAALQRLDALIAEQKRTNELLEALLTGSGGPLMVEIATQ